MTAIEGERERERGLSSVGSSERTTRPYYIKGGNEKGCAEANIKKRTVVGCSSAVDRNKCLHDQNIPSLVPRICLRYLRKKER